MRITPEFEEIYSILSTRRASGYQMGSCGDGSHLALVIEGGGMRGVTAGAMVSALEDMELRSCFDSIHGSSAGAATGAYFLAGQAKIGTSLFFEDLNGYEFINPLRLFLGRPIMDTSYLVDFAMVERKCLDFACLQISTSKLYIACTDIDLGTPYIVSNFKNYDFYRTALKASIAMPFYSGASVKLDGRRLLDGGILQQIALDSAVGAGATHILTLVTRTETEMTKELPNVLTRIQAKALGLMYGGLLEELYYQRNFKINDQIRQLHAGRIDSGALSAFIALPNSAAEVGRLTRSRSALVRSAITTYHHTRSMFESAAQYPDQFSRYTHW